MKKLCEILEIITCLRYSLAITQLGTLSHFGEIRGQLSLQISVYLYPGVLAVHGDAEVVCGGDGVQPGHAEGGEAEEEAGCEG